VACRYVPGRPGSRLRGRDAESSIIRRKSPVVLDRMLDNGTHYAVDVTGGGRSSAISQDAGEQVSRDCVLRHLEGDVAAVG
jgi:hypothetical protein